MGSFSLFILVYILGGLTFVPLLLALLFLHAYITFPYARDTASSKHDGASDIEHPTDDEFSLKTPTDGFAEKFQRAHEADVAAGYFAVCREYVPGGVNGKPPERTTPAGEVIAAESPSVYQSMYRSIFDRKQVPTLDSGKSKGNGKTRRNVFFVVLRHGHLMLYDDAEQLEVRYVISLSHHNVTIYGGGEGIPEGELWIKRNAICLSRKDGSPGLKDQQPPTLPFYLFSENLSEKEDFYFAILNNLEKDPESAESPPTPLQFETKHVISLVQRLHSSEEHLQTRWFNALTGRLFLAMYKTPEYQRFIWNKISKKISRVKKPNFITKIELRKIDPGEGAPLITNPKLKDLTADGDCCVEMNVDYTGNFRVEIAATARLELGTRFKPREVDLVLAVVLKKLSGRGLLRFKPPPSNRAWMSFEAMPSLDMSIEPIVSSRQITYGIILRAIESRIREVIAETFVLPFWDDAPFLDTTSQHFRGGIWKDTQKSQDISTPPKTGDEDVRDQEESSQLPGTPSSQTLYQAFEASVGKESTNETDLHKIDTSISSSSSEPSPSSSPNDLSDDKENIEPQSEAISGKAKEAESSTAWNSVPRRSTVSALQSRSFPTVNEPQDADLKDTSSNSQEEQDDEDEDKYTRERSNTYSNAEAHSLHEYHKGNTFGSGTLKPRRSVLLSPNSATGTFEARQAMMSIGSAAASAAKKWGLNILNRNEQSIKHGDMEHIPDHPIGRGRPLPPIGTPLPSPARFTFNSLSVPKRKPAPLPLSLHDRTSQAERSETIRKPAPAKSPHGVSRSRNHSKEDLLVIKAPPGSEPNSPSRTSFDNNAEDDDSIPDEWSNQILIHDTDESVAPDEENSV